MATRKKVSLPTKQELEAVIVEQVSSRAEYFVRKIAAEIFNREFGVTVNSWGDVTKVSPELIARIVADPRIGQMKMDLTTKVIDAIVAKPLSNAAIQRIANYIQRSFEDRLDNELVEILEARSDAYVDRAMQIVLKTRGLESLLEENLSPDNPQTDGS